MWETGTPKQSDMHVIQAQSDSSKGHIRSINDLGHCANLLLLGTRTRQSREVNQRIGMVWRPTAATRAASSGRHWLKKVSNANVFISELMVF